MSNYTYIWMLVTRDKYELPLYVCDTARELAEFCGTTENNIYSAVCHQKTRGGSCEYLRVRVTKDGLNI